MDAARPICAGMAIGIFRVLATKKVDLKSTFLAAKAFAYGLDHQDLRHKARDAKKRAI